MSSARIKLDLEDVGGSRKLLDFFASFYGLVGAIAFAISLIVGYQSQSWLLVLYGSIALIACLISFALLRGAVDVVEYLRMLTVVQLEMLERMEKAEKKT